MKNIIISITTMCSLFWLQGLGQISSPTTDKAKNNFTFRMNNHIAKCLDDPEKMANVTTTFGHTCDKNHTVTPEEIKATAVEAEKHAFIQSNMDEYMNIFFPEKIQASLNTTVEICDNGGMGLSPHILQEVLRVRLMLLDGRQLQCHLQIVLKLCQQEQIL